MRLCRRYGRAATFANNSLLRRSHNNADAGHVGCGISAADLLCVDAVAEDRFAVPTVEAKKSDLPQPSGASLQDNGVPVHRPGARAEFGWGKAHGYLILTRSRPWPGSRLERWHSSEASPSRISDIHARIKKLARHRRAF